MKYKKCLILVSLFVLCHINSFANRADTEIGYDYDPAIEFLKNEIKLLKEKLDSVEQLVILKEQKIRDKEQIIKEYYELNKNKKAVVNAEIALLGMEVSDLIEEISELKQNLNFWMRYSIELEEKIDEFPGAIRFMVTPINSKRNKPAKKYSKCDYLRIKLFENEQDQLFIGGMFEFRINYSGDTSILNDYNQERFGVNDFPHELLCKDPREEPQDFNSDIISVELYFYPKNGKIPILIDCDKITFE